MTDTKTRTMIDLYDEVHEDLITKLNDGVGLTKDCCDLHHFLCNEDYFIIGTFQAKEFLGSFAFDVIQKIKEYEDENFGECHTTLDDAEKVVNMFAFIVGQEFLNESEKYCELVHKYGYSLTKDDLHQIMCEVDALSMGAVINKYN